MKRSITMFFSFLSLLALSTLVSALPMSDCSAETCQEPGTTKTYDITIGPHQRTYNVFLPTDYNSIPQLPMILSFHGNSKSAEQQQELDQFCNPLFNKDHIVVYPQGYKNHWQPGPYAIQSASDLDFIAALLPELSSLFHIDSTRIYAAGKSVGGGFVDVLACDPNLGPQFAAFAPVSAALYWETPDNHTSCNPGAGLTHPRAILEFHGLADGTIPYEGGPHGQDQIDLPKIEDWATWWMERNGCSSSQDPQTTPLFGGNVTKIEYTGCNVTHYTVAGLGHCWPATVDNPDSCPPTVLNATEYIMDWFGSHNLST